MKQKKLWQTTTGFELSQTALLSENEHSVISLEI